ncbi:glycine-rich domain-containing protein [Agrobacterium radiobacter]|uniref:glycine-rich domain-containing protein n=1 Tax=Agrobacterium radiobacter TaxID=362 RepID=UPI003F8250A0
MAFYTDGVPAWNSLDDNTRAPLASELEDGYPCGEADQELFNWTAGWPIGNIWNMLLQSGITPDTDKLLDLARAVQAGKVNYAAIGGSANALTMTLSPAPASWSVLIGTPIRGIITTTNTGACTLNVNGLGAKPIKIDNGSDPIAGDLKSGSVAVFIYDGTNVQIAFSSSMMKNRLNAGATIVTYSTAGSFAWVVPADVRSVFVRVWGGGGGGGGSQNPGAAGGGGGGGYAEGYVTVTPGATVTVTVGAGGTGGLSGGSFSNGVAGGSSSFGPSISATGGGGGERAAANSQGVSGGGGTGTGGSRQAQGGTGSSGTFVANTQNVQLGGSGGAAGGGGGGGGGASSGLGSVGQSPGGGGGAGASGQVGSAGAAGTVIIEYFVS